MRRARGLRILVVDDSADTADLLALLLARVGHDVRVAYSGRDAIAVAAAHAPELVIVDTQLPDVHGEYVARALRDQLAARPYLVALSCQPATALRTPFDAHACKPIDLFVLQQIVAAAGEGIGG